MYGGPVFFPSLGGGLFFPFAGICFFPVGASLFVKGSVLDSSEMKSVAVVEYEHGVADERARRISVAMEIRLRAPYQKRYKQ